jgi:hypothetical protein
MLAGGGAGFDLVGVVLGRGADPDGVHVRVVDNLYIVRREGRREEGTGR